MICSRSVNYRDWLTIINMCYQTLMPAVIYLIYFADHRCPRACNGQGATNVDELKVAVNECAHAGSKQSSGVSSRDPHSEDV